jgi:hypothetical protein
MLSSLRSGKRARNNSNTRNNNSSKKKQRKENNDNLFTNLDNAAIEHDSNNNTVVIESENESNHRFMNSAISSLKKTPKKSSLQMSSSNSSKHSKHNTTTSAKGKSGKRYIYNTDLQENDDNKDFEFLSKMNENIRNTRSASQKRLLGQSGKRIQWPNGFARNADMSVYDQNNEMIDTRMWLQRPRRARRRGRRDTFHTYDNFGDNTTNNKSRRKLQSQLNE